MRIVVVNLNRLGDIVQSSPIVTTLRREYPTARIVLLVRTEFAWVAERIEGVDEVVRWNIGEIQALVSDETRAWVERADRLESLLADPRLRGADLLVNASHNDAASALARLFEPVRVIGQRLGAMGTPTSENLALRYFHELLHFRAHNPFNIADLYRMAGGKAWAGAELAVRPGDGKRANAWLGAHHIPERARLYGIQPGASQAEKRWPPVRCAAFARHVVAADEEGYVLVFGSPGESALVDEVVAIEHPRIVRAVTSLDELWDLIARLAVLVTNDTGPMHLAAAANRPVILTSLGPTTYVETGPFCAGALAVAPRIDCFPCHPTRTCPSRQCHNLIEPELIAELALARARQARAEELTQVAARYAASAEVLEVRRLQSGNLVPVPLAAQAATAREVQRAALLGLWAEVLGGAAADDAEAAIAEALAPYRAVRPEAPSELAASVVTVAALGAALAEARAHAHKMAHGLRSAQPPLLLKAHLARFTASLAELDRLGASSRAATPIARMVRNAIDSGAPDSDAIALADDCARACQTGATWAARLCSLLELARNVVAPAAG